MFDGLYPRYLGITYCWENLSYFLNVNLTYEFHLLLVVLCLLYRMLIGYHKIEVRLLGRYIYNQPPDHDNNIEM